MANRTAPPHPCDEDDPEDPGPCGTCDSYPYCDNPKYAPALFVTREMAIDAGDPTMAGALLKGEVWEPCGSCPGCYGVPTS
jgi:hypothetical protein